MVSSSQRVTSERAQAMAVLSANTVAFTVCFAVWMLYGVLITYLVNQRVCAFTPSQVGWLIGLPVLTGALTRLPVGLLADRFGGRPVMLAILLWVAAMTWLSSYADTFWGFALGGRASAWLARRSLPASPTRRCGSPRTSRARRSGSSASGTSAPRSRRCWRRGSFTR